MTRLLNKKWSNNPINRQRNHIIDGINDLEGLRTFIENNQELVVINLRKNCKNLVFSSGNTKSPLMIIGEAPGSDEDDEALPFVGRSGQLLNKMLQSINIDRNKVYVTNIVNYRPENNRTPTLQEIEIFQPIIEKHIEIQNPKYILILGASAMKGLKIPGNITEERGNIINILNRPGMILFHPSYLLRKPEAKKMAWEDLQKLSRYLIEDDIMSKISIDTTEI